MKTQVDTQDWIEDEGATQAHTGVLCPKPTSVTTCFQNCCVLVLRMIVQSLSRDISVQLREPLTSTQKEAQRLEVLWSVSDC